MTAAASVFHALAPGGDHRCGIWAGESDDLEAAQRRRAELILAAAGAGPGSRLLDLAAPTVEGSFDAVVSDQGLEHAVTPAQRMRGEQLPILSGLFARAHAHTVPGTRMGLGTLTAGRLPRAVPANRALAAVVGQVPLWRLCHRPEDVVKACGRWWEVREAESHQHDYARTAYAWLRRLREREVPLRAAFGDGRYRACEQAIVTCARAFEDNQLSLMRLTLWRTD